MAAKAKTVGVGADIKFRSTTLETVAIALSAIRDTSDPETINRRVGILENMLEYALQKPEHLSAKMASCLLCPLWVEAAVRSGSERIELLTFDEENEIVHPAQLLANLRRQDLPALLRKAQDLIKTAQWLTLWTFLKDAFGVQIVVE